MEKSNLPELRSKLKESFEKYDTNKNGYLDIKEVSNMLQELGENVSDEKLNQFFSEVDKNHDGQLSFEEVFTWMTSNKGSLGASEKLKLKLLSMAKNVQKIASSSNNEDVEKHVVKFNLGNTEGHKTKIGIKAQLGQQGSDLNTELRNGLDSDNPLAVVFQFQTTNAEAVKEQFESVLEQVKGMAGAFLPPNAPIKVQDIKTNVVANGDEVKIGISLNHPEVDMAIMTFVGAVEQIFPDGANKSVIAQVSALHNISEIFNDQTSDNPTNIIQYILEGVQFLLEADLAASVLKGLREQYYTSFAGTNFYGPHELFILLSLLKGSSFEFNMGGAKSSIFDSMLPGGNKSFVKGLLEQGKMTVGPMLGSIPFLVEFLTVAVEHIVGNVKVSVCTEKGVGQIFFESDGFADIYNYLTS